MGGPNDPLDPRTAWLYSNFLSQSLPGYDFSATSGRRDSARALQHAIWYIEQEQTAAQINALPSTIRTKTWDFINLANANNPGSIGLVRVLALYTDANYTNRAQDILCQVIPAPGALVLSGIGTLLLGALRGRRLAKAN